MKKQKGHDYSTILIWSAALVTVVRYAAAFVASDAVQIDPAVSQLITIAMGLSGVGMGLLDVLGGAYLFDGWRRVMPRNDQAWPFRFKVLTFFAIGLILNGIAILIPFTMSRVSGRTMYEVLGDTWLIGWSTVVNVAPYLLIGGVATGNQLVAGPAAVVANEQANGSPNGSQEKTSEERTYKSLTNADKYYIINNSSAMSASMLGVTPRAIQKWRKRVQEEIAQNKL